MLQQDDILMTKDGTIGKIAYVDKLPEPATVASGVFVIRQNSEKLNQRYLYNYFRSYFFKHLIKSRTEGSVIPHLYQRDFKEMLIPLPKPKEQETIADTLFSITKKEQIHLSRIQTLEKLSNTLFLEWSKNRNFSNSLSTCISLQGGYAFKGSDFQKEGIAGVIKIKNIQPEGINIKDTDYINDTSKIDEKFKLKTGDVIIAMTGAEVGKTGIIPNTKKELWLNQRVGLFQDNIKNGKYLALAYLNTYIGKRCIDFTATGSAQPNISGDGIENIFFLILTKMKC